MTQEELYSIITLHGIWLKNKHSGKRAKLVDADLSGLDIANVDLSEGIFHNVNFSRADLRGSVMCSADFEYCEFTETKMEGLTLIRACLYSSTMENASCRYADMSSADLYSVVMSMVDCSKAKFFNARITRSTFYKVNFAEADLSMALFMDCHDGTNVVDCEMPLSTISKGGLL